MSNSNSAGAAGGSPDWDPALYGAFSDLRGRPLSDLLARAPVGPEARLVADLGCGAGAAAAALRRRFPQARLIGVEPSAAMRAEAAALGIYDELADAAAESWRPDAPVDLIFSNAALQWTEPPGEAGHERLISALLARLAPGGALAAQMPRQEDAPSHRLIDALAHELWPERFPAARPPRVAEPAFYANLLSRRLDAVDLWETVYWQRLSYDPQAGAHPVRRFTESTAAQPVLGRLDGAERARFLDAYDAALHDAYPPMIDDTVWLPFRRLFLVAQMPG